MNTSKLKNFQNINWFKLFRRSVLIVSAFLTHWLNYVTSSGGFKSNEYDGHYRDTRSPSNPVYNMSAVLLSSAHRALRTIYPTASTFTVMSLRSAATVTCEPPSTPSVTCYQRPCLFDLERDPCETTDLAFQNTYITGTEHLPETACLNLSRSNSLTRTVYWIELLNLADLLSQLIL